MGRKIANANGTSDSVGSKLAIGYNLGGGNGLSSEEDNDLGERKEFHDIS